MHLLATFLFHLIGFSSVLMVLVSTASAAPKQSSGERPRVALWVEAEGVHQPFDSLEGYEEYQKFIDNPDITDVFCQVYRGGRSWFPSELADEAPFYKAQSEGFDPLGDTIRKAHARGQRVHAWVNILRIAHNKEAPIIKKLGKKAVLEDSFGVSLLDYRKGRTKSNKCGGCKIGTPGIWLEPANPEVRQYLREVITELLFNYPDLDGVHLDMVRSPIASPPYASNGRIYGVGYSMDAVKAFHAGGDEVKEAVAAKKKKVKIQRYPSGVKWREFRRSQVTKLVSEIGELIEDINPDTEFSVAVLPNSFLARRNAYQDWPNWADQGIVDTVIPMVYTRNVSVVGRQSREAVRASKDQQALIGLGAWLLLRKPTQFDNQIGTALISGADGIALFSYSNLLNKHGYVLMDTLKSYMKQYK